MFGYELLYRHALGATTCTADGDFASASVLTSAILDLGLETLTNGRQAFLNVTRALLLGKLDTLIPPHGVVIELLESVEIDHEVIDTCRDLRSGATSGFTLFQGYYFCRPVTQSRAAVPRSWRTCGCSPR